MELRSVKEADVRGRAVLLRAGLNVPVSGGRVVDDFRLLRALETLELLLARGARVMVLAHIGRKQESLRPVFAALAAHLPHRKMRFHASGIPAAEEVVSLRDGEALVLENVRRLPGEETNDPALAKRLASLADLYVNDAFSDSHREHASIVGIPAHLPSYAGLVVMNEMAHLIEARNPTRPAVAVIGGAKFETKEPLLKALAPVYDTVMVGGAIVNDIFKAQGIDVGDSLISETPPDLSVLMRHPHIEIPTDVVVATERASRTTVPGDMRKGERIVDAGPETGMRWAVHIQNAGFVLMNGPLGVYERGFNTETERLAKTLAHSSAYAVVGGGDTIAALRKTNFDESRVFLSTGGGAMLDFLAHGTLPGLLPLMR
jgi:phosphoglycerate kinase